MAQLSRPYQIGLVAVALLAAAWLLLLQGHHSSSSGSESSSAPAPAAHAPVHHASAGQATGSGSASSLGALGHDVEKARGAVATSKRNAHELEKASASASSVHSSSSSSSKTAAPSATHARSAAPSATTTSAHAPAKGVVRAAVAPRQHVVEAQLRSGRTVLIFFWNPKGSDDRSTNRALNSLPHGKIAIDRARANAVATFGTITRGVQVFGTPTLLVLNHKGQVTTLTGLQDTYTISQAIREARKH